jgi:hypothetical protein
MKTNVPPSPPVYIIKIQVNYLGLQLARGLSWHKHIFAKRTQLRIILTKIYWLHGFK